MGAIIATSAGLSGAFADRPAQAAEGTEFTCSDSHEKWVMTAGVWLKLAQVPTGTGDTTKFLRGDWAWAVPTDSNSAAATAVVKAYTAVATDGNLIGTLESAKVLCPITATAAALQFGEDILFDFGHLPESGGIVLRGVAQEVALLYPVAAATVPTQAISVEWTEE